MKSGEVATANEDNFSKVFVLEEKKILNWETFSNDRHMSILISWEQGVNGNKISK